MDIVVSSSGLQAVLESSEEFVEQVTFGFGVNCFLRRASRSVAALRVRISAMSSFR